MAPTHSTLRTGTRSNKRNSSSPPTPPLDYNNMSLQMKKLIGSGYGGRIGLDPKKQKVSESTFGSQSRQLFSEIRDEEADGRDEELCNSTAPKASRCTIETGPLDTLIHNNCICKNCGGPLRLLFKSIGIATIPSLHCENCKFSKCSETATLPKGKHPRTSDYAVNCQHIAACVASGDGGSEAGRILGLLDLPNYATMEKFTFPKVEHMMHGQLQSASKSALDDNLREEVRLSLLQNDDLNYESWANNAIAPANDVVYACIRGSCDMGWQKRASGRRCDSLSGHEFIVGALTRKPISMCVKSKFCRMCSAAKIKSIQPRQHNCRINHTESSGSMESDALLDMTHELHNKHRVHLSHLCTDDDSTMRARCRYNNADHQLKHGSLPMVEVKKGKNIGQFRVRQCTGKLLLAVPEPKFVADPAHRKKTLRNKLHAFNGLPAPQKHGFGPADITRTVKNFSCFVNTLHLVDSSTWADRGKCALDHHFDDHAHCGDFCLRKKELKDKTPEENSRKFCRSKANDPKMYEALHEIVSGFVTQEKLEEVGHGMDTQPNEAINNAIAWKAPKGKTCCGSVSLENRVCMAISTHLIGPEECFKRSFQMMGIRLRSGTAHCLKTQARRLVKKRTNQKKVGVKTARNEKNFIKLREQLAKQLSDAKAGNKCEPGVAMTCTDNPMTAAVLVGKGKHTETRCKSCGNTDHQRRSSLKCKYNKVHDVDRQEAEQQALLDQVEVEVNTNEEETDELLLQIEEDDNDDCLEDEE